MDGGENAPFIGIDMVTLYTRRARQRARLLTVKGMQDVP